MSPELPPLTLLVSGPTASGKSDLAVRLARALKGEIINIDSVQVYRGADVGSAKIPPGERQGVPHHLLDLLDPSEPTDVAFLCGETRRTAEEISARGSLPILVGSSGMYITALFRGLAELPRRDESLRRELELLPNDELHRLLASGDPTLASRLHPNDRVRLVRALETLRLTGVPASEHYARQSEHGFVQGLSLVVCLPRTLLYERIDRRAAEMVRSGLVAETATIRDRFGDDAPVLKTLGYAEALRHLRGTLAVGDLAATIARNTRRYAKRQLTFWRNEPTKRGWTVSPSGEMDADEREPVEGIGLSAHKWGFDELCLGVRRWSREPPNRSEVWYVDGASLLP